MMQETTRQELRTLLTSAQIELRNEATRYAALLKHLELLEQSIAVSELSDELLASTMAAFPPNVKPMRAGTPTGEGLKETRKLWDELNHIVKSRQKKAV